MEECNGDCNKDPLVPIRSDKAVLSHVSRYREIYHQYLFFYPDQFLGGNNCYVNFSSMAGIKIATGTGQLQIQRDRDRQIIRGRPTDR